MKRRVLISIEVEVTVDETRFTETWLSEWQNSFYAFDTVEEHVEHIGQLEARGALDPDFTEGYGKLSDMGISAVIISQDTEIVP